MHANCLRKLFLGALMLESIPFIGNGSHSWQGCQLERYDTDQLNLQFSDLTIQLDVHISYYIGALITQDHLQSQNSSMDRMLSMHAVTRFQV